MKRSTAALLVVSVAVIAYLVTLVNVQAVESALLGANPLFIVAALFFALLSLVLRVLRWQVLLEDKHKLGFGTVFCIQSVGLALSNLSPGKLLEPVKVVPLRKYGVGYSFGLLSVFWERAFDLVVLFGFTLLVLPFFGGFGKVLVWLGFAALLLVLLLMFRHYKKVFSFASRLPFLAFLSKVEGHDFRKRILLASLVITLMAWVSDSICILMVLYALGISEPLLQVLSAWCASVLVGVVSFLPGGLGSTEAALVFLLGGPGRAVSTLVAAALLVRLISTGLTLVIGLALLPKVKRDTEEAGFTWGARKA